MVVYMYIHVQKAWTNMDSLFAQPVQAPVLHLFLSLSRLEELLIISGTDILVNR